jgi:basic membrane protein A
MTTYYGKLYEPLFLIGLIAGLTTRTGILGWLGPSGQPGSLTAANAFLLGARTVHPGTRLIWTTGNGSMADSQTTMMDKWEDPAILRLVLEGADCILTAPDDGFASRGQTGLIPFALLCPQDGTPCTSENCLASVAWNWADFYGSLFSQWVDHRGNWPRHPAKPPFISFLGGMDSGLTDISWKPEAFTPEARKLIHHLKQSIMEKRFSPFQGPLYDSDGQLRVSDGQRMEDRAILDMDWAVDGVGRICP